MQGDVLTRTLEHLSMEQRIGLIKTYGPQTEVDGKGRGTGVTEHELIRKGPRFFSQIEPGIWLVWPS
jgi:hypothetical protein